MDEKILHCLKAKVEHLKGKVMSGLATVEEFLEKTQEVGADSGYGFYNPGEGIGVVFPGFGQDYSLGLWEIVRQELPEEFGKAFKVIALETGEIIRDFAW